MRIKIRSNQINIFNVIIDKPCVSDVILPDVSMKPVGEVEILVVHTDDDVCHYTRHLWENPALNLMIKIAVGIAQIMVLV